MLLTATRIHNGLHWLPEGAVIEAADDGTITAVHEQAPGGTVVHYDGVLCPGWVNAHCHLELSHMKGVIAQGTGLIPFLQQVTQHRNDHSEAEKHAARHAAYEALLQGGVVAVGDIANSTDTTDLRARDQLHLHTLIESIGFTEANAPQRFAAAEAVYAAFAAQQSGHHQLLQSIVPHAPYSVSAGLMQLIDAHQPDALLSIHNQESAAEDEYYRYKTGAVGDLLGGMGIDTTFFAPSGKSSVQTYLQLIDTRHTLLLVHNTYSSKEDIAYVQARMPHAYWCLCPNANLYIEGRLPDVPLLMEQGATLCVGTDSLSSNTELSMIGELRTLHQHYPELSWEDLLRWATYNGACALQLTDHVGQIAEGLRPGLVWIPDLEQGPVQRLL